MNAKVFRTFLSFLIPYWKREVIILILIIMGTIAGLASPYFLKIIIDKVIPEKDSNQLILILLGLSSIYLFRLGIGVLSDYLNTWLSNQLVNDIKTTLISNLLKMPYAYFDKNKPGDIIQRVNNEIHKIQFFLTNSCIRLVNNVFSIIGISIMLCLLNYKLFFISITVFPFAIIINKISKKKLKFYIEKSCRKEGDLYNFYIDRIKNIKLIKGFNSIKREITIIRSELNELFSYYLKTSLVSSIAGNAATFFVALGPIIILGYGGLLVMQRMLTIGAIVAFIQYMNRLYAPTNDMVTLYVEYVKAKVSMDRIAVLLNTNTDLINSMEPPLEAINCIRFKNVSFNYGDHTVIRNINLELHKGKKYGFVGLSGSGKSTFIKLLGKFYPVDNGTILINEKIELQNISNELWNDYLTILHQESLVLIETLKNNLLYANPYATDEEIWTALDLSNLSAFVKQLPEGLNTVVGEGGICFSGGQQQQIALARAFLKMSDVLILDESTSAIDSFKEANILNNIADRFKDKILLSISHRLSSIKNYDEILVLENGEIVERGTHQYLLGLKGNYFSLFKSQLNEKDNSATIVNYI